MFSLFFLVYNVSVLPHPIKKARTYAFMHMIGIYTTMFVYLLTCWFADELQVEACRIFFITFPFMMLFRCILDGEMLVWDTSLNRFAEFGSNQEIGL